MHIRESFVRHEKQMTDDIGASFPGSTRQVQNSPHSCDTVTIVEGLTEVQSGLIQGLILLPGALYSDIPC